MSFKHKELTDAIIGAFYRVYNTLGHGFLEKVYENALAHELRKRGYRVVQQAPIKCSTMVLWLANTLRYACERLVMLELKAAESLYPSRGTTAAYLKSTKVRLR